jgi:Peptidase A4 family
MRFSARSGLAAVCAAGAVAAVLVASASHGSAARSSTHAARTASRPLSARFLARARTAVIADLRHMHPNIPVPGRTARVSGNLTKADSFNWGGYADTSTTAQFFSAVSGNWTVPAVSCSGEDRIVSVWVGLDGDGNSTVEQDGTTSQCYEGVALYYTWYEMYPAGSVEVGSGVKANDAISASVVRTGTSYALKVTDSTTSGGGGSTTQTCPATTCLDESAEWITERPAYSIGIVPLALYKTPVSATASSVTGGGKTGNPATFTTDTQLTMIDATQAYKLAITSGLTASNTAFTVSWHQSY